jgi:hypothetical protein
VFILTACTKEGTTTFRVHYPLGLSLSSQFFKKKRNKENKTFRKSILFNPSRVNKGTGKGKGHPITGHEGPVGEYRHISTLSLTSALDGVGSQRHASAALPPGKKPGTHCTGGWVGPRTGLARCGKSRPPHQDSIPGPPRP